MNVLLGDKEGLTVENHSLRSKYSACSKKKKIQAVVFLILITYILLGAYRCFIFIVKKGSSRPSEALITTYQTTLSHKEMNTTYALQ
jgi:hypothetical protein